MGFAFCQPILQCLGDQIADRLTTPPGYLSDPPNQTCRQLYGENRFGFRKSQRFGSSLSLLEVTISLPSREVELDLQRSHPLGQGAACKEEGTFVDARFVAQWRFDRSSRRKSKSKTQLCFKARREA